ncbi:GPI transamidase component [Ascosphaera atra]|nr:GPI transamidase component [Ascosphaera atra]
MADSTPALADAPPPTGTTTTTTSAPSSSTKPTHTAPPPEPPRAQWTRTLVIFSFWAVVLFLGLPMWWKTTTVHREQIPIEEMQSWADGKSCRPVFPLQILVEAPEIPVAEAETLLQMTQHTLDDLNDFSAHHLRLRLTESPAQEEQEQGIETPAPSSQHDVDVDTALTIKLAPRATRECEVQGAAGAEDEGAQIGVDICGVSN